MPKSIPPLRSAMVAGSSPDSLSELFLTEKELAARWQISVKTLRNARVSGTGCKFFKGLGFVRYRLTDVIEFERMHMRASTGKVIQNV